MKKQRFPTVSQKCNEAFQEYILRYLDQADAFVSQIPQYILYEGNHTQIIQLGELQIGDEDFLMPDKYINQISEIVEISGQGSMKNYDIRYIRLNAFRQALESIARGLVDERGKSVLSKLSSTVIGTNRAIDAGGKPFTFDLWLQTLESMDIEFDKKGIPLLPTTVIPPALLPTVRKVFEEIQFDSSKKQILHNLLSEKREIFYAKEANRKLVD